MKRTLAIAVLVSLAGCSMPARHAEPPDQANKPEPPTLAGGMMAPVFPADWVGHWKGYGAVENGEATTHQFNMELDIQPIARADGSMPASRGNPGDYPKAGDRYTWKITYTDRRDKTKPADVREYQIVVRDPMKGQYVIDEGGGIELPLHDLMGPLYSVFSVGDRQLVARYAFSQLDDRDAMHVEVLTFDPGNQHAVGDAAQAIRAGSPQTLQSAELWRKKSANEKPTKAK
ncbi:MAG: hypothetical protein IT434_01435 [Phycisphaerales bacterium]|nr:hypothetical protein [Phycisphaerales bacterium]